MVQILKNKKVKVIICLMIILIMLVLTMKQSYAAGDVSSVIQQAWKQMESQIKNIVNNVVFPVIDIILAVFFFAKLAMAYFDPRLCMRFWKIREIPDPKRKVGIK